MSERAGSVRDARHLSGADIGRTITVTIPGGRWAGPLYEVTHTRYKVTVTIGNEQNQGIVALHPHDAVTITAFKEGKA
mgnify:CR=1 FL=1